MGWFLYDNGLRHERVKQNRFAFYKEVEIDRIGKPYKNEILGLTNKPVIIKFKSWRNRDDVYRNQPRRFENDKKKAGGNSFSISQDLTK